MSNVKLSDLPLGVQSHIISFLSNGKQEEPVKLSLSGAETIKLPLPDDLLAVAQASSTLAAAVGDTLGSRAKFVTSKAAKRKLPQWITALSPFVKAVSVDSSFSYVPTELESYENAGCKDCIKGHTESVSVAESKQQDEDFETQGWMDWLDSSDPSPEAYFALLCDDALSVFKSLSADQVSLQVLDLKAFPINTFFKEKQLLNGLVNVLRRSRESLRELSLPVLDIYSKALARVTLKNLRVVEFVRPGMYAPLILVLTKNPEPFLRMLQALDGHADRPQKKNALLELRLGNFSRAPFLDVAQSGCTPGFFNTIKSLRVGVWGGKREDHDSVATFICLFPKLECLHWNGVIEPKHLYAISNSCTNLQELHLSLYIRSYSLSEDGLADDFSGNEENDYIFDIDASTLEEIFIACLGKLKGLDVHVKLSMEHIQVLGETNPGLQRLRIEIGLENVKGLVLLLGTLCREIHTLEITIPADIEEFGIEGVQILSDAILTAPVSLRRITTSFDNGVILSRVGY